MPADLVLGNANYRRRDAAASTCRTAPTSTSAAPTSSATSDGTFLVLEDNARTPSGVSYVLENRHLMLRVFPDLSTGLGLRPVDDYGRKLLEALREVAPAGVARPAGRAALARRLQLGLFRARLPRPRDGRAAGRGPRPRGRGRPRLHADHRRARAGRRDLPPDRRRLPRSRRPSGPTACSACPG